jgi:outer membrane immunogenic protein
MMKRSFVAGAVLTCVLTGSATAADMPIKSQPMRQACAQFGGSYLGINGGWAYHDTTWVDRKDWVDKFSRDYHLGSVSTTRDGGTVGGQIGYNWQRNCTLFGIEVDANWADLKGSKFYSPREDRGFTDLTLAQKVQWFGTIRARTGLIIDDLLLYVTGGVAYANIKHAWTMDDTNGDGIIESFSSKTGRWGLVGGVGAEWAWTQNWSIKSEVLYIRFREQTTSVFSEAANLNVKFDHQDSMWVARLGLNYRFSAPY